MRPFTKWMVVGPDGALAAAPSLFLLGKPRAHQQVDFLALYDSEEAAADAMSGDSLAIYRERAWSEDDG